MTIHARNQFVVLGNLNTCQVSENHFKQTQWSFTRTFIQYRSQLTKLLYAFRNTTARTSCHELYFADEISNKIVLSLSFSILHFVNIVQYEIFVCSNFWLWYSYIHSPKFIIIVLVKTGLLKICGKLCRISLILAWNPNILYSNSITFLLLSGVFWDPGEMYWTFL